MLDNKGKATSKSFNEFLVGGATLYVIYYTVSVSVEEFLDTDLPGN